MEGVSEADEGKERRMDEEIKDGETKVNFIKMPRINESTHLVITNTKSSYTKACHIIQ